MAHTSRLTLSAFGDNLVCSLVRETLSHKAVVPYDAGKVLQDSERVLQILARGNRERKLADACLRDLRAITEELYRVLIPPPVRDDLARLDQAPLLIEIDESLVAVPWELLYDGTEYLCRRFDIGRSVATTQPRLAPSAKRMSSPVRMLVLCCDPRGDLMSIVNEGDAVMSALDEHPGVTIRLCANKPIDFVRKVLKDYDIVHFAGHADYDSNDPASSGWYLSNGKITARDVSSLAGGRPMPLLVFSNACQSSHGPWKDDPSGLYGLANAFLLAGVRYYIGTRWEVVDLHSKHFAQGFYTELAKGRSVGMAVRKAREAIVVAGGEGALGWAGYVLYGDPAYVPLQDGVETSRPRHKLPTPAEIVSRESMKAVAKYGGPRKMSGPAHVDPYVPQKSRRRARSSVLLATVLLGLIAALGIIVGRLI